MLASSTPLALLAEARQTVVSMDAVIVVIACADGEGTEAEQAESLASPGQQLPWKPLAQRPSRTLQHVAGPVCQPHEVSSR
eukprot:scaffold298997_cov37-Prasinocladus_malaysianus.AAC.1